MFTFENDPQYEVMSYLLDSQHFDPFKLREYKRQKVYFTVHKHKISLWSNPVRGATVKKVCRPHVARGDINPHLWPQYSEHTQGIKGPLRFYYTVETNLCCVMIV